MHRIRGKAKRTKQGKEDKGKRYVAREKWQEVKGKV